jgi:hypothetical protein
MIKKIKLKLADLLKPPKKYFYKCYCIRCKGKKVDSRTQEKHTKEKSFWNSKTSRENQERAIKARKKKKIITSNVNITEINLSKKRKIDSHQDTLSRSTSPSPDLNPSPDLLNSKDNLNALFTPKSKSSSHFHAPVPDNNGYCPDGDDYCSEEEDDDDYYFEEDDDNDYYFEEEDEDEDEDNINREEGIFAPPEVDSDEIPVMESLNDSIDSEIIIWVFKFQQRFKIPDTALEAIIKFLRAILTRLDKSQFDNFPTSLYKAKKWLKIFEPKMQLAVCTDCHKLHNVTKINTYKEEGKINVMNCLNEEFPNNPIPSHRKQCNNQLSVLKRNKSETIAVPRMLYPKPNIRQQLAMLYQRPGFEKMLKASKEESNVYSDIYDGKVWKTFPFNGSTFFTAETAATHLGLLFNLDWFQPFTYTTHSTGAIYASICNLPRSERSKPENIIYMGFLPGPKEVGLERINHYLAPIVDELLELWKGWKVPKTYECSDGLDIKVALIISSSDTPATRKLFGHGGAAMKCYRCEKRSTYSEEYRKNHYGGMENYNEWLTPANASSHRKHAQEWLECNSKSSRENHFKEHGVR